MMIVPNHDDDHNKRFTIEYTKEELDKIQNDFLQQMSKYIARVNARILETFENIKKEATTTVDDVEVVPHTIIVIEEGQEKEEEVINNLMSFPTDDENSIFIIADNSSEIVRTRIFPDNFIEPLVILAKIKGYKGIDDYVVHLIEDELESIRDGGQGIQDLGEYVIKYIAKILGPDDSSSEPN